MSSRVSIPFVQRVHGVGIFIGNLVDCEYEVDPETAVLAKAVIRASYAFVGSTKKGVATISCERAVDDAPPVVADCAGIVAEASCQNGPEVPATICKLIVKAYGLIILDEAKP